MLNVKSNRYTSYARPAYKPETWAAQFGAAPFLENFSAARMHSVGLMVFVTDDYGDTVRVKHPNYHDLMREI